MGPYEIYEAIKTLLQEGEYPSCRAINRLVGRQGSNGLSAKESAWRRAVLADFGVSERRNQHCSNWSESDTLQQVLIQTNMLRQENLELKALLKEAYYDSYNRRRFRRFGLSDDVMQRCLARSEEA